MAGLMITTGLVMTMLTMTPMPTTTGLMVDDYRDDDNDHQAGVGDDNRVNNDNRVIIFNWKDNDKRVIIINQAG